MKKFILLLALLAVLIAPNALATVDQDIVLDDSGLSQFIVCAVPIGYSGNNGCIAPVVVPVGSTVTAMESTQLLDLFWWLKD